MKYIYRHHLNIINGSLSKALSNIIFFCIREGFKKQKKVQNFPDFSKPTQPTRKVRKKIKKITWSKNHF